MFTFLLSLSPEISSESQKIGEAQDRIDSHPLLHPGNRNRCFRRVVKEQKHSHKNRCSRERFQTVLDQCYENVM